MKLLYVGDHLCPADSLARLLVLSEELVFLDRPSVAFDKWGTIGRANYMRQFSFDASPVPVNVVEPQTTSDKPLYASYAEADLRNTEFISAFLTGIRSDEIFAQRVIPAGANYGNGIDGITLRQLLLNDRELEADDFNFSLADPEILFRPDLHEGRKAVLSRFMVDVSIQITSALLNADRVEAIPVADDATLPKLLSLRASNSQYVGETHTLAPYLGLAFARSVIPDEALRKLNFSDILDYRQSTKDVYRAWNILLNATAAKIESTKGENPEEKIKKLIATELQPKAIEYENELTSAREKLFGNLIKGIAKWEMPTLTLAHFSHLAYASAVAAFAAAAIPSAAPHVVDYLAAARDSRRKHGISYVVGLTRR